MHKQFALLSQIAVCTNTYIYTADRLPQREHFEFPKTPWKQSSYWTHLLVLFAHKVTTHRDACEVIALYTMTSMCQFYTYYVYIYFPFAYQAVFGSWHSLNCYYHALHCRHSILCNMNLFIYRLELEYYHCCD